MQTFSMQTCNMPLVIVTMAEAQANLPELLGMMATGKKVVISDGEKWVGALAAPPPMPLTPEQEEARQARVKAAIREMVKSRIEDGYPPEPDSPLWQLLEVEPAPK